MVKRNEYIDDDNLSELSSLTHLLDNDDGDNDTNDTLLLNILLFLTKINLSIS